MEKTTSRKLARKRLLEAQQEAAAAREARERANLNDLTEFSVRLARVDEVDEWLATRIEKLRADAEAKREVHRRAAGKAVNAMRLRGETMPSISVATGLSVNRLRELMKFATEAEREGGLALVATTVADGAPPSGDVPQAGGATAPVASVVAH